MAATAAPTFLASLGGNALGQVRAFGGGTLKLGIYNITPASGASDYATGGQDITAPADVSGEFLFAAVLGRTPLTRTWHWNGSQSAPKLIAEDAFGTQEGAGADVSGDTLYVLLGYIE